MFYTYKQKGYNFDEIFLLAEEKCEERWNSLTLDICKKENPYSKNSEFYKKQIVAGQELSKKLEDYIKGWLAGKNPAEIPAGYLGEDIDNAKTNHWKLYKPDEITAEEQWYGIPAR